MEDFDISDPKLPNGICGHCRMKLLEVENGNPNTLEDPVDFSTLSFPVLTRAYGGISNLEDIPSCQCSICMIARANPGQEL